MTSAIEKIKSKSRDEEHWGRGKGLLFKIGFSEIVLLIRWREQRLERDDKAAIGDLGTSAPVCFGLHPAALFLVGGKRSPRCGSAW